MNAHQQSTNSLVIVMRLLPFCFLIEFMTLRSDEICTRYREKVNWITIPTRCVSVCLRVWHFCPLPAIARKFRRKTLRKIISNELERVAQFLSRYSTWLWALFHRQTLTHTHTHSLAHLGTKTPELGRRYSSRSKNIDRKRRRGSKSSGQYYPWR